MVLAVVRISMLLLKEDMKVNSTGKKEITKNRDRKR